MANLGTPVLKNSKFNFDHSNVTTCNFGSYQPILAYELMPQAKVKFRPVSFVRLTNMIAPTYGLMKLKTTCGFVPTRLLYPNFTQFLSGQQVNTQDGAFIPTKLPTLKLRQLLGVLALLPGFSYSEKFRMRDSASVIFNGTIDGTRTDFSGDDFMDFVNNSSLSIKRYDSSGAEWLELGPLQGLKDISDDYSRDELPYNFRATELHQGSFVFEELGVRINYYGEKQLQLDNVAFTFDNSINIKRLLCAFRGVGLNVPSELVNPDFMDEDDLNVLALLAYVRLYLEHLVPQREFVFEDSKTFKFINYLSSHDGFDVLSHSTVTYDLFRGVIDEVMDMFYTLPPDVFTSALNSINNDSFSISVRTNDNGVREDTIISTEGNAPQGQVTDSITANMITNLLATLKYSNRNTVTGRNVMNWLRSRFGVVPDAIKDNHSYFLGTQNTDIKVTDLYATANSNTGNFGRMLGSYTGRGGAFSKGKNITFRAEEFGYFICMQVMVPMIDYYQGVSPHCYRTDRLDFYTTEYDGKSYDAIRYSQLNASHINSQGVYGFYPRYSDYKYITSTMNGDFRFNKQDISAFHLFRTLGNDFVLDDGFRRLRYDSVASGSESFLRIFANTDATLDHFIIYNPLEFRVSQPCKPLSKSYEVEDNGNDEFRVDYT